MCYANLAGMEGVKNEIHAQTEKMDKSKPRLFHSSWSSLSFFSFLQQQWPPVPRQLLQQQHHDMQCNASPSQLELQSRSQLYVAL